MNAILVRIAEIERDRERDRERLARAGLERWPAPTYRRFTPARQYHWRSWIGSLSDDELAALKQAVEGKEPPFASERLIPELDQFERWRATRAAEENFRRGGSRR